MLAAEVFATNCGTPLSQLPLSGVAKNARGVAFATAAEAHKYMAKGKFISMHTLRVPAIYTATMKPVLLECTSAHLGDQDVDQKTNKSAPEVAVFASVLFRTHVFRDLWEAEHQWNELVDHPVRCLVSTFPLLRLCKDRDAKVHATCITPALRKKVLNQVFWMFGVSNGLRLMVPNLRLRSLQCCHAVYMRVPQSSYDALHIASVQAGVSSLYQGRKISQHRTTIHKVKLMMIAAQHTDWATSMGSGVSAEGTRNCMQPWCPIDRMSTAQ